MAKDPAFLFYPNDWTGGTVILSRHLKGCYIDLLIAQFNHGSLSLEEIRTVLGTDFSAWNTLQKKFAQDATGKFFNERLQSEIEKRKAFTDKQKLNGSKGGRPKNPSLNPTINPNQTNKEDENGNENGVGKQGGAGGIAYRATEPPSIAMVQELFVGHGLTAEDGEEHWRSVNGNRGWHTVNNWLDYATTAIRRKLNEKNYQNGKQAGNNNSNRVSNQKRSVEDVKNLAREILQQPGSDNGG